MIGIALLQNGQLPSFISNSVIEQLLVDTDEKCIVELQKGLNNLGLLQLFKSFPVLLHLLRPNEVALSAKMLKLLKPEFSEEGSSAISREKQVYGMFVKYVRDVASGRRNPVTLGRILVFCTGATEEPVLGFYEHPSIHFESGNITKVC